MQTEHLTWKYFDMNSYLQWNWTIIMEYWNNNTPVANKDWLIDRSKHFLDLTLFWYLIWWFWPNEPDLIFNPKYNLGGDQPPLHQTLLSLYLSANVQTWNPFHIKIEFLLHLAQIKVHQNLIYSWRHHCFNTRIHSHKQPALVTYIEQVQQLLPNSRWWSSAVL